MIAILDYGMGNLRSVAKAFEKVGASVKIITQASQILQADKLVVPGVGAFGDCIQNLQQGDRDQAIRQLIASGKPYLGICLGMQILMDSSEEAPDTAGLGIFKGSVPRFSRDFKLKVPHMGWNNLQFKKSSKLFQNIPENSHFYFVHSYFVQPEDEKIVSGQCTYGISFAASLESDNVFATQFHPEKSQQIGLKVLENFVKV